MEWQEITSSSRTETPAIVVTVSVYQETAMDFGHVQLAKKNPSPVFRVGRPIMSRLQQVMALIPQSQVWIKLNPPSPPSKSLNQIEGSAIIVTIPRHNAMAIGHVQLVSTNSRVVSSRTLHPERRDPSDHSSRDARSASSEVRSKLLQNADWLRCLRSRTKIPSCAVKR